MENKDQFIKQWYEGIADNFSVDTSYCLFIDLIRKMRLEGLEKEDLETVGPILVETIEIDTKIKSLEIVAITHIGYTIKKAFDIVYRDIKEIKEIRDEVEDEGIDTNGVKRNTTDDVIPSSEPQIDLSNVEYGKVDSDEELEEYLSSLRFENYE